MLKNYFRIAFRNLTKNRVSSLINIGGLALGMSVAILIGLWIYDELSFNSYHNNYDRIAQVKTHAKYDDAIYTIESQPMPLAKELLSRYSDDVAYLVMSTSNQQHVLSDDDKRFSESGRYMQSKAPELLGLKMLGGAHSALNEVNSIFLSETLAKKMFGDTDPLGRILKIDNKFPVTVTGIYEDIPDNSAFKGLAYIAPFDLYLSSSDQAQKKETDWNSIGFNIYVQIKRNADLERMSSGMKNILADHASDNHAKRKPVLFLHPMNKWHLYSKFENGVNVTSEQLNFIWFYGIIGAFVLFLACINFMNLSTARSEKRAREVGIRKAIGSLRKQLIIQFFGESILVAFFSFILSILIVQLCLPFFNIVAGKKIAILWDSPFFWLAGVAFILFTGLLAGIYPALYLSSFNPVKVLKGSFRIGRLSAVPRQVLVVLQFTVSIILIIATIVVYRQLNLGKTRPTGYSSNGLIQIKTISREMQERYDVFRSELKNSGAVSEIAESASPVTSIWSTNTGFTWKGNETTSKTEFATIAITHEYGRAVGWQFIAGRDFSRQFASDSSGLVINETAAKLMAIQNPIGESIQWTMTKGENLRIIGVIKDMVMESPFTPVYPSIFFVHRGDAMNCMLIKMNPGISVGEGLSKIEAVFKKLAPSAPFEYGFVSDEFAKKFESETRISKLASIFAGLAILISCLGLFGLASFIAEQRNKEIGVRKILGASVFTVWRLLTRDFIMLILISLVIAIPVAYYFMYNWLQNYEYRIEITWWIFALAGLGTLMITLATVSYQSIKAALTNPIQSLRTY